MWVKAATGQAVCDGGLYTCTDHVRVWIMCVGRMWQLWECGGRVLVIESLKTGWWVGDLQGTLFRNVGKGLLMVLKMSNNCYHFGTPLPLIWSHAVDNFLALGNCN